MGSGWRPRGRRLMAAPVALLAVLALAGAVLTAARPPSWLGWVPPWALAAAGAALAALGTWLVEPWAKRRRKRADQDQDALQELGRYLGWSTRLPRLSEVDPLQLRVHKAIPLPDGHVAGRPGAGIDPQVPTWVERDIASKDLRPWLVRATAEGGFLVVVGDSSTGKTRLLYQILGEQVGDWPVLAPDLEAGAGLVNTLAEATVKLPKTGLVVWLDELQRFLTGPHLSAGATGLSATAVRKLLDAPIPVLLVGALWPDYARELRAEDTDPDTGTRRPRYPAAADVLASGRIHQVTLHTFNPDERRRAARLAATDPRLADALAEQRYGVTQVLAGAPELIDRYRQATAHEQAIVDAAADALRLGVSPPLVDDLLQAVARTYLDHAEPDDRWYPKARDALSVQAQRGGLALLSPIPDPTRQRNLGFTLPDYPRQHLTRERATVVPPTAAWDALADHVTTSADLMRLVDNARVRGLGYIAETLYRAALTAGADVNTRYELAELLDEQGRADDAAQAWRDAAQVLRDAVAGGDHGARIALSSLLQKQGRLDEAEQILRDGLAAGHRYSGGYLAKLLKDQGRPDEAEQILQQLPGNPVPFLGLYEKDEQEARDGLAVGDPTARRKLAVALHEQGRLDEAEQVWRDGIAAGDAEARGGLAGTLEARGRLTEAEQTWRDAITAGEPAARAGLAWFLRGHDRLEEAEQTWRDAVAAGDADARGGLSYFLQEQGRVEEAVQVLREEVAAGDPGARKALSMLLLRHMGGEVEAEQVLRDAVAAGEPDARGDLADQLLMQRRYEEAEQVLRDAVAAGDRDARRVLASLLKLRGRLEEAEQIEHSRLRPEYLQPRI